LAVPTSKIAQSPFRPRRRCANSADVLAQRQALAGQAFTGLSCSCNRGLAPAP